MIEVTRVRTFEAIGAERWNGAVRACARSSVFQLFEYQRTWWKHFGESDPSRELFLLLAMDGATVVGIAPLMVKRVLGVSTTVQFIGTPACDFMDFIVAAGREREVLEQFLAHLGRIDFLEVDLHFILEGSRTLELDGFRSVEMERSPYIALDATWETVHQRLNATIRQYVARRVCAITKTGTIRFGHIRRLEELDGFFDDYFRIHIARWGGAAGKYSQFQQRRWRGFVRDLSTALMPGPYLDLSYLKVGSEMIAGHFGFIYGKVFHWYIPAYNPAYARFSPGHLLILHLLRDCCERRLTSFDFLRGQEPYKLRWTPTTRILLRCLGYPKHPVRNRTGRALRQVRDLYQGTLKGRLKRLTPLMAAWYWWKRNEALLHD